MRGECLTNYAPVPLVCLAQTPHCLQMFGAAGKTACPPQMPQTAPPPLPRAAKVPGNRRDMQLVEVESGGHVYLRELATFDGHSRWSQAGTCVGRAELLFAGTAVPVVFKLSNLSQANSVGELMRRPEYLQLARRFPIPQLACVAAAPMRTLKQRQYIDDDIAALCSGRSPPQCAAVLVSTYVPGITLAAWARMEPGKAFLIVSSSRLGVIDVEHSFTRPLGDSNDGEAYDNGAVFWDAGGTVYDSRVINARTATAPASAMVLHRAFISLLVDESAWAARHEMVTSQFGRCPAACVLVADALGLDWYDELDILLSCALAPTFLPATQQEKVRHPRQISESLRALAASNAAINDDVLKCFIAAADKIVEFAIACDETGVFPQDCHTGNMVLVPREDASA